MKIAKQDIIFVVIVRILGLSYKERLKLQAFFVYTVLILDYYNFFYLCITYRLHIIPHTGFHGVFGSIFSIRRGSNSPVLLFYHKQAVYRLYHIAPYIHSHPAKVCIPMNT